MNRSIENATLCMQIYAAIEGATHFFSARYVAIARVEMTWGSVFTRLRRDRVGRSYS